MYNSIYPKEALEVYLILGFDKSDYNLQNVFYIFYHSIKEKDNWLFKLNEIIKNNILFNEVLEKYPNDIYKNFSIESNLEQYNIAYSKIREKYLSFDNNILYNVYNSKMELYNILNGIKDGSLNKENEKERFEKLLSIVENYTDKNDVEGYRNYFENKNNLVMKFFTMGLKEFSFDELNQLSILKNKGQLANKIPVNCLKEKDLSLENKKTIKKYISKSIIFKLIVLIIVTVIMKPFNYYNIMVNTSNNNMVIIIIYVIVALILILYLIIDIVNIINVNKKVNIIEGYISDIYSENNENMTSKVSIYFPLEDIKFDIKRSCFTSKLIWKMRPVIVVKKINGYVCIPIDE